MNITNINLKTEFDEFKLRFPTNLNNLRIDDDNINCTGVLNLEEYTNLKTLDCSGQTNITEIINYSDSIKILFLACCDFTDEYFANLPVNLIHLSCGFNKIVHLDNLPMKLEMLYCSHNKIVQLDNLPESLKYLSVYNNELINLDNLPNKLIYLDCSYNNIVKLDCLPDTLKQIFAVKNKIISVNHLPKSLYQANFSKNYLITRPNITNANSLILLNYSLDAEKTNSYDKLKQISNSFIYNSYNAIKYSTITTVMIVPVCTMMGVNMTRDLYKTLITKK